VASHTGSLQYEDSISCTLYRFLLPLCRHFDFAPFFVVERKIFVLSKKSSSAFFLVDFPSIQSPIHPLGSVLFIEPTLSHKNPPSLSSFRSRPRRILRFSRSPINPFSSSSFHPSAYFSCSLGRVTCKMSRLSCLLRRSLFYFPLSSGSAPEKALIDFAYALSVFESRFIPRLCNQLFPQSYDSCLQFRFVSPSISVVSTLYSSRYPQCLLSDIVHTL
jgi:hypothetical protein